jgi:hypothetical protein
LEKTDSLIAVISVVGARESPAELRELLKIAFREQAKMGDWFA